MPRQKLLSFQMSQLPKCGMTQEPSVMRVSPSNIFSHFTAAVTPVFIAPEPFPYTACSACLPVLCGVMLSDMVWFFSPQLPFFRNVLFHDSLTTHHPQRQNQMPTKIVCDGSCLPTSRWVQTVVRHGPFWQPHYSKRFHFVPL